MAGINHFLGDPSKRRLVVGLARRTFSRQVFTAVDRLRRSLYGGRSICCDFRDLCAVSFAVAVKNIDFVRLHEAIL